MGDALIDLVARQAAASMNLNYPRHEPFFDWLARRDRAAQSPADRAAMEQQAARFADSVLARRGAMRVMETSAQARHDQGPAGDEEMRIAASSGLLRLSAASIVSMPPAVSGPLAEVIELAARRASAPVLELRIAAGGGRDLWEQPSEQWIELPPGLPRGRYLGLGVDGDSMQPLLYPGDTILVRLGPRLVPDTVVVAHRPDDGYVVKRVEKVAQRAVELGSLNPAYEPIRLQRRRGTILGTVVAYWRSPGSIAP